MIAGDGQRRQGEIWKLSGLDNADLTIPDPDACRHLVPLLAGRLTRAALDAALRVQQPSVRTHTSPVGSHCNLVAAV